MNSEPEAGKILSGMRPTGRLHLGHYHGVLKNWVRLQERSQCFFFVADWHALIMTLVFEGIAAGSMMTVLLLTLVEVLSFMRLLLRRMKEEMWKIQRVRFDLDVAGYGRAVYEVHTPDRQYSLAAFANPLADHQRTDRVIASAWDAAFVLFDGKPTQGDLERLADNAPHHYDADGIHSLIAFEATPGVGFDLRYSDIDDTSDNNYQGSQITAASHVKLGDFGATIEGGWLSEGKSCRVASLFRSNESRSIVNLRSDAFSTEFFLGFRRDAGGLFCSGNNVDNSGRILYQ